MGCMAKWGPKEFVVSPSKIIPFDGFSTSKTLKSDSENDTSGTPPKNTRGFEPRPIAFETTYMAAAGVDPRGQVDEWESLVGKEYPLYIGARRFGPSKIMLKSVDTSDLKLTNSGQFLSCKVALKFEEFSEPKSTKKSTKSSKSKTSKAVNATASKRDRARVKPKQRVKPGRR